MPGQVKMIPPFRNETSYKRMKLKLSRARALEMGEGKWVSGDEGAGEKLLPPSFPQDKIASSQRSYREEQKKINATKKKQVSTKTPTDRTRLYSSGAQAIKSNPKVQFSIDLFERAAKRRETEGEGKEDKGRSLLMAISSITETPPASIQNKEKAAGRSATRDPSLISSCTTTTTDSNLTTCTSLSSSPSRCRKKKFGVASSKLPLRRGPRKTISRMKTMSEKKDKEVWQNICSRLSTKMDDAQLNCSAYSSKPWCKVEVCKNQRHESILVPLHGNMEEMVDKCLKNLRKGRSTQHKTKTYSHLEKHNRRPTKKSFRLELEEVSGATKSLKTNNNLYDVVTKAIKAAFCSCTNGKEAKNMALWEVR